MKATSTFKNLKQDKFKLITISVSRIIILAFSLNLISVYDKTYYYFVGVRPEEIDNKKAHRKELQRIIACSIYNKI